MRTSPFFLLVPRLLILALAVGLCLHWSMGVAIQRQDGWPHAGIPASPSDTVPIPDREALAKQGDAEEAARSEPATGGPGALRIQAWDAAGERPVASARLLAMGGDPEVLGVSGVHGVVLVQHHQLRAGVLVRAEGYVGTTVDEVLWRQAPVDHVSQCRRILLHPEGSLEVLVQGPHGEPIHSAEVLAFRGFSSDRVA